MTAPSEWLQAITTCRQTLSPKPTRVEPRLQRIPDVRAVIFDVYGTLLISGSGDVGSIDSAEHDEALQQAYHAVGLTESALPSVAQLHAQISEMNEQRKSETCPKPEVDIVEAWRRTLAAAGIHPGIETVVRLACQYEARANPTWPMPEAAELIQRLAASGRPLGIVSNAQVFTVPLVENLIGGAKLATAGFDLDLCVFSNRFRQAKPGPRLFDVLREALTRREILPQHAIYVGNDMLNDVWAASQAGLRTAWFAGDVRSCRDRQDDPRCRSLRPDVVLTSLMQLLKCFDSQ